MKAFYTDHFVLPLPEGHRFPMAKYAALRRRVAAAPFMSPGDLVEPPAATDDELRLAHGPEYLDKVRAGRLDEEEERRLGFPWSPEMVERSRRSTGATVAAARSALEDGRGVNLAGGTHHAFRDRGEGFCVFNDSAVALRILQREGRIERALVVDTDVHQGNGTAAIFGEDPTVFTLSLHCDRNYPFRKERSDLDVALPAGTGDDAYLAALKSSLALALERSRPDLVIYLSGADAFEGDKLGRLALTREGLVARDRLVLGSCEARGLPVAITMGGGYAPDVQDIVAIHFETIALAAGQESSRNAPPASGSLT